MDTYTVRSVREVDTSGGTETIQDTAYSKDEAKRKALAFSKEYGHAEIFATGRMKVLAAYERGRRVS